MKSMFYFSRIVGNRIYSKTGESIGKIKDLVIENGINGPKIVAINILTNKNNRIIDFSEIFVEKVKGNYVIKYNNLVDIELDNRVYFTGKQILDRQIININGRKLFRVNDLRLIICDNGVHIVAIDIGAEGFLRRLGIAKFLKFLLDPLKISIPNYYLLWDKIGIINFENRDIKLSEDYSSLKKIQSSDLINY